MAYNNYNPYGNSYGTMYGFPQQYPQQIPMPQPYTSGQQAPKGIDWVDGEAAAKATQLPPGVSQHAMWDINEPVIYIKSMNQMGMPNPIQKIRYQIEEQKPAQSGQARLTSGTEETDMSDYVRKDELEAMKEELKETIRSMGASEAKGARTNGKSAV